MIQMIASVGIVLSSVFAAMLWHLWKDRNLLYKENIWLRAACKSGTDVKLWADSMSKALAYQRQRENGARPDETATK